MKKQMVEACLRVAIQPQSENKIISLVAGIFLAVNLLFSWLLCTLQTLETHCCINYPCPGKAIISSLENGFQVHVTTYS